MKNKTVIIIEDSSKANMGGGQQISSKVAKLLSENKSVKLIFTDYTSVSRYAKHIQELFVDSAFVSLKSSIIKSTKIPNIIKRIFEVITLKMYFGCNFKRISKKLPEDKTNTICYVASKKGLTLAYKLKQKYGIDYVFHAHLVENPDSLQFKAMKKHIEAAKSIICVSKAVLESYGYPKNAIFMYNAQPYKERRFNEKKNDNFVVAYIGGLIPIKGVEYFIEAAKADSRNNVSYRVYGEGILRDKLESNCAGRVEFMGYTSDVMKELRDNIDILVLPTIIPEALPGVIVEAKTAGIPVISTNIGGQAEIIEEGKNGLLVPIKDGNAIYEAIIELTGNIDKYNKIAEESFRSSSVFSVENFNNTITKTILE